MTNFRAYLNPGITQALGAAYPNIHVYDPENNQYLDFEGNPVIIDKEKVQKYVLRIRNYPLIQEQLDMMYWDQVNGTTVWRDTIAKIKSELSV